MPLDLPKCDVCEQNDVHVTCIKCDSNFCKTCDEKHHSKGKFKEHQRDVYSGLMPSRFCTTKSHEKQQLNLFCQTCSKLICGFCVVGDHKSHTCEPAEVASEKAKGILKNAIVPLQEIIKESEIEIKTTQDEIKVLQGEIIRKEQKIKETKKKIDENLQKIEEIKLVLNKNQVDSFILLSMVSNLKVDSNSNKLFEPLASWLKKPVHTWKLLYKWTKDEKSQTAWHTKCDNKGPTVTIIWTKGGYVFGAYAHLPWAIDGGWKESKESFIFSLTDGKNRQSYQCLPFQNFNCGVFHHPSAIAMGYGDGCDIFLQMSPGSQASSSDLGGTYKVPDGYSSQTFLAGSRNWTIEELETYSV